MAGGSRERPGTWGALAAAVLVAGTALAWYLLAYIPGARAEVVAQWRRQLETSADLRKIALDRWIARGLGDARILAAYPSVVALAAARAAHGDTAAIMAHVHPIIADLAAVAGYRRAAVLDASGTLLVGDAEPGATCLVGRNATSPSSPEVWFHTHPNGTPMAAFLAPVRAVSAAAREARPIGLVLCEEDPALWLYPFLAHERLPLRTGEVLLVQQEGDDLVFVNPLEHRRGAGLALRLPLGTPRLAGAAALVGGRSFGDFIDYRGTRVLAATRHLQNAPLGLVVKLDEDEALEPFVFRVRTTGLGLGAALVATLAVGFVLWRGVSTAHQDQLRRLWRALEHSPVSVVITDASGRIEYVNPKFTAVTGYTSEETLGRNPRILKSGETPVEVYADLWRTITAGREWRGELRNRKKNGDLFWEQATISAVRNARGVITRFVAVKEDVTERKEREAALRLAEQQLVQAQKMEAIGRLAGGVAHDFNNILNVIMGYAELLGKNTTERAQRERVEHILKASSRAAGLTRQLLAFSRRQLLAPKVICLSEVVSETVSMLERVLGEDVELSVVSPPDLGCVRVDPGQVAQILMNLAVNARDAMPAGGRLTIELDEVQLAADYIDAHLPATPGPYVRLTVTDNGSGMTPDVKAHAFEPFFTTKEPGRGTGLGLATVYGIVKQSGGYIWLYSEPGHGTSFKIYLPRVSETKGGSEATPKAAAAGHGETVLLVEDDDALRSLGREILESNGYRVLVAAHGAEALRVADAHHGPIAILVTDVIMPGMGAREFIRGFLDRRPEARVLCVSGYTDDAVSRQGVLDAGLRVLQKPFTEDALTRAVAEALSGPHGPAIRR